MTKAKRQRKWQQEAEGVEPNPHRRPFPIGDGPEYYPPVKWPINGVYLSPYTVGGDAIDIRRRLSTTDEVFNQTDKSLNRELWLLYPFDQTTEFIVILGAMTHRMVSWHSNPIKLDEIPDRVAAHGNDMRAQIFALLHLTAVEADTRIGLSRLRAPLDDHTTEHPRYLHYGLINRLGHVQPLAAAVARVEAQKTSISASLIATQHFEDLDRLKLKALVDWIRCLYELLPWHADCRIFTGKQAFEHGVAQLHGALLYNCGLMCLQLAKYDPNLYVRAAQFATLLIEMRYIKHSTLIKAIKLHLDAHLALAAIGTHFPIINTEGRTVRIPRPRVDKTRELIARMERKAVNPDAWAHEHCLTPAHEGCI